MVPADSATSRVISGIPRAAKANGDGKDLCGAYYAQVTKA
jgi:hypothetical protein